MNNIFANAKLAAKQLRQADRQRYLRAMQQGIAEQQDNILAANAVDVAKARSDGMSTALVDRLQLTPARLQAIGQSFDQIMALPDPIGITLAQWQHPQGMQMRKVSVPFGVIGMIYESRPNVTADAAMLCIKAGSAVILRGSSNALASNQALVHAMRAKLAQYQLCADAVQLMQSGDRSEVNELLQARGWLDLLIPRGGAELIKYVVENAKVPVIETGTGVCHLYVHESADFDLALKLLLNGKVQRPGVCNSLESLLIDQTIAASFAPLAAAALTQAGVRIRACSAICAMVPNAELANEADYGTEYLDLIINARVVAGLADAIEHIDRYGTKHSEAICARDLDIAQQFQQHVDAAAVYVNASTRFSDGFEFGFGAEIGISTQKLHARGPMGLREIVSYQYLVDGTGQIRN